MSAELFSNVYNGPFSRYLLLSKDIGQDVQNQSEIVDVAFQNELRYLQEYQRSSTNHILNQIFDQINKVIKYTCADPILGDHINVVAQSIKALLWVQEKDPVMYLEEVLEEAKSYTDVVLAFFKDKELHVEWVEAWLETLRDLNNLVRRKYPKGISQVKESTELEIHQVLLKKNHEPIKTPAVFFREGKRWKIEHQTGNIKHLTIKDADADNVVYIYDSKNVIVVVESKINVIKLDKCENLTVIFRSLISGLEIIACKNLKLHAFGTLPSISIDSSDDVDIHLTKKGLEARTLTSQCSKISISYPMDDGYYKTFNVPSRMMTTVNTESGLSTILVDDQ